FGSAGAERPDGPEASPVCCELLRGAYRALAAMPENERIALSLRHIAEIGPGDIAPMCATDTATVEKRIARAMARLRTEVERDPVLRGCGGGAPPRPAALVRFPA